MVLISVGIITTRPDNVPTLGAKICLKVKKVIWTSNARDNPVQRNDGSEAVFFSSFRGGSTALHYRGLIKDFLLWLLPPLRSQKSFIPSFFLREQLEMNCSVRGRARRSNSQQGSLP